MEYVRKLKILPQMEIIDKYQSGLSITDISRQYEVKKNRVYKILKTNNIPYTKWSKKYYDFSDVEVNDIISRYNNRETITEIARFYKACFGTISRILKCHKVEKIEIEGRYRSRHNTYSGYKGILGLYWGQIRRGAKSRGVTLEVTIQDAWSKFEEQDGKCALSGIKLYFAQTAKEHKDRLTTASLDRIDNSKGYTVENIQWLHKDINIMKKDLIQSRFIELCKLIGGYN